MRSTADLDRITPLVWNELTTLGVPFIRCGVSIIHEETQNIEMFLSNPEGLSLAKMDLDFNSSQLTKNSITHWRVNKVFHQHWAKEEFVNWTKSLIEQGHITDNKSYQGKQSPPESLDLYFVPFTQGSLYVGSQTELSSDEIELVKSLADAFSIAYARYEDFVKLEKAKAAIEETLSELKATQKQLIQSEKMASLGELTAGIAHEIQNPLNFVNNFSEVSGELVDELNEELEKGDLEEVKFISADLKQNLQKINHHGQRASSIVKGMLEHSRKSSGTKELTDINALADEYLRLAYHGLRAKDKDFNAEMLTDFDANLPKIEVIPQDIGRVLLNLINNAFQAVSEEGERRKQQDDLDYKPLVSVKTKLTANSQVLIAIKDNGPGIPDEIKDKIFQPFFTTKDTGKGTGLGLSLAYDIVKAHGGEIVVECVENRGSCFNITLPN
jgi:signal transduction histidine kinase